MFLVKYSCSSNLCNDNNKIYEYKAPVAPANIMKKKLVLANKQRYPPMAKDTIIMVNALDLTLRLTGSYLTIALLITLSMYIRMSPYKS